VGQRLRRLSEWAVASCITAAVGCSEEPPVKLTASLTAAAAAQVMPCSDLLLVTAPVAAPRDLDYIGVFSGFYTSQHRRLLSDYGEPCKTAQDRDACLSAIERAIDYPTDCKPGARQCGVFIVTSLGNEVLRHGTPESLREVMGDVNTASEAVLFAQLYGLHVACAPESTGVSNAGTLVQATDAGWRVQSRWSGCGPHFGDQVIEVHSDGTSAGFERNLVAGDCTPATARRTAGLQLGAADATQGPVGAFLAQSAQLEAASVPAFNRLARELLRLGAPQLAAAAKRSARDEAYHAALMQRLAARYGGRPSRPHVATERRSRTAYEIAHENAVEGCVRESFGALIAWQQSVLAADPMVAQTMRRIAVDETWHAQLSWQVAEWLEPQLTATERMQIARARAQAVKQLQRELATDFLPDAGRAQLGWPSQAQRHALLQRFAAELDLS